MEGITIANSAAHSLTLNHYYDPENPTDFKWVKIMTWRANGDGIDPHPNGLIEDCFIRTQDDASYVTGRGIKRVVFWKDSNGSTFKLSHIGSPGLNTHPLIVEDCTVVYSRSHYHYVAGSSVFNLNMRGGGSGGYTIIFRNINVEDPRPTLQAFKIFMKGLYIFS